MVFATKVFAGVTCNARTPRVLLVGCQSSDCKVGPLSDRSSDPVIWPFRVPLTHIHPCGNVSPFSACSNARCASVRWAAEISGVKVEKWSLPLNAIPLDVCVGLSVALFI